MEKKQTENRSESEDRQSQRTGGRLRGECRCRNQQETRGKLTISGFLREGLWGCFTGIIFPVICTVAKF